MMDRRMDGVRTCVGRPHRHKEIVEESDEGMTNEHDDSYDGSLELRQPESERMDSWISKYVRNATVVQGAEGRIDIFASIGGWPGIAKNFVPGTIFIIVFVLTSGLFLSSAVAVGSSVIFAGISVVRKEPLLTSVSGLAGVGLCALVANRSGEGRDYYVPGFYLTGAALVFFIISLSCRLPLIGVLFGYIRGEGLQWRRQPSRYRSYYWATLIIIMVFALRLAVQIPLYLTGEHMVWLLGTTRLAMGVPLYAAGLWLAWVISRPVKSC